MIIMNSKPKNTVDDGTEVNVLLIKDDDVDMYTAICMEVCIVAMGKTESEALKNLTYSFGAEFSYDIAHGRIPFKSIPPTPQKYLDMYEEAQPKRVSKKDLSIQDMDNPITLNDVRLAA